MIRPDRASAGVVKLAVAGLTLASALTMAGHAAADPEVPSPTPVPADPAAAMPPPPIGPPPVPEIPDPSYGQGQTPGQFGYLRDLWHAFHSGNPIEALTAPPGQASGPPPGAGPPPPLPPGFVSLTAPAPPTALPAEVGPGPAPPPDMPAVPPGG